MVLPDKTSLRLTAIEDAEYKEDKIECKFVGYMVGKPINTGSYCLYKKKSFGFSNFDWVIYSVMKLCLSFLLSFLQFGIMYMDLI